MSEILYYDLNVYNYESTGELKSISFQDQRTVPFLHVPENYEMSIVRFQASTIALPAMIPFIPTPVQLDVNGHPITDYKISLLWTGTSQTVSQNVVYIPEIATSANDKYVNQLLNDPYFFIYSYSYFCDLVNTALKVATDQLKILVGAALNDLQAPCLIYEPSTQLFSIRGQTMLYDKSFAPNYVCIGVNDTLASILNTMPIKKNYLMTNNNQIIFTLKYETSNLIIYYPNSTTAYNYQSYSTTSQENSTTEYLNPVQSIYFTSLCLPICPEIVSAGKLYGSNISSDTITGNNNSDYSNVLTDYLIGFTPFNNYKNSITYAPTAEYRMVNMRGVSPLTNIDLRCLWKDKYNNSYNLYLVKGGYANVKIMFRKKNN